MVGASEISSSQAQSQDRRGVSKRHTLFCLQMLGIVVAYIFRVCVSTAAQKVSDTSSEQTMYTEFHWTTAQQSAVLGSFFYGYMLMQVPGAWLTARLGPTQVFGHGVLWASLLTVVTPFVSKTFPVLIVMRVLTGLVEGVTYPAMSQQVRNWAPAGERSGVMSFIMAGAALGTAAGVPLSAALLTHFGWRSIFFVTGAIGCVWSCVWFATAADSPAKHGRVSATEMALIGENPPAQVPLGLLEHFKLLQHRGVRAICAASWAYCWAYYMVMTELPSYLATVLGFSVAKGGFLGVLPFLCVTATTMLGGVAVDQAKRSGKDAALVRRICYCVSAGGASACLLIAAYVSSVWLAFSAIVIGTGFVGLSIPAYAPNIIEVGGSQAASVFSVQNTFASITGFVAPQLTGALTAAMGDASGFRLVFWITCFIYAVAAAIFVCGISVETIPLGQADPKHAGLSQP